jgi:O-antigen/teichoic acid export membrane protein
MVPFLFAGILLPMLSRMLKNKEKTNELIALNFKILMTPIIIFVVASVFYNVEIIENLFKYEAAISAKVYKILILNVIPVSLGYIFGTLLTANGSLKKLNTYAAIGAILNIILNIILIPQYKTLGAAFASLTTQSFAVLLQIIYANKIFKFKISTISIIKFFSFIFITIGIMYFSKNYFTENWIYNIIIASSLSFAVSLLLKIINIKSFLLILKKKL